MTTPFHLAPGPKTNVRTHPYAKLLKSFYFPLVGRGLETIRYNIFNLYYSNLKMGKVPKKALFFLYVNKYF